MKMDEEKKKRELEVYAPEKAATITLITGIQHIRIDGNERYLSFFYPNLPQVKAALQNYFDDVPLPCRSFADLTRSLKQQLHAVKKQRATARGGKDE
jgi:hypothetical protein